MIDGIEEFAVPEINSNYVVVIASWKPVEILIFVRLANWLSGLNFRTEWLYFTWWKEP